MTIGSLFSGSGMLDEAVRAVIGGDVAWHAEHEPATEKNPNPTQAAARVLAYHYPGVPNLGDISAVDWSVVPRVDVLTGGFPCQDVSHAGRRAGLSAGTRSGLWARMCDVIEALRPQLVVIENVRGLTSACADSELGRCPRCVGGAGPHVPVLRALGRVLGDLAELGYDAQWVGLPASDVGAPHERFRVFITAVDATGSGLQRPAVGRVQSGEPRAGRDGAATDAERGGRRGRACESVGRPFRGTATAGPGEDTAAHADRDPVRVEPVTERRGSPAPVAGLDREATPDSSRNGCGEGRPEPVGIIRGPHAPVGRTPTPADPDSGGLQVVRRQLNGQRDTHRRSSEDIAWGDYEPAIRRWEALTRPAPAPTETGTRGGQRLSRWFDEWMMGWPDGWVTDVPGITYREAIRICGNGVVPQQAAAAVRSLLAIAEASAA